ncbi:LysR family transcriptional regulator [Phenylobacterium sp.]|uniref:LysR family transcriptional regulator n=1 Tax=Phenylobacterium sp. TaxID=1871053 RepID=UPI002CA49F80|nr:LysR family transcriptional regulator [Phenylobacterium sp.]HLZ74768.1 LysR family transcriptional regulator [Phenylobacterium sp.]
MSKLPDFEGLAIFAKVLQMQSFARAAGELQLSKATVSKAVSRLEVKLGARLFNRTSRRLSLTEAGKQLAERAAHILAEGEAAEAEGIANAAAPRGHIRLAAPMSFGVLRIAPILPEFLERFPEVSIDLHLSDAHVDIVGEGFDAAIRIADMPDSSLLARTLAPMPRYLVAAPKYLAEHGRPSHPLRLSEHRCIGYASTVGDTWHFSHEAGDTATVRPTGPLRVNNGDAMMPLLTAGSGLGILPDFILRDALDDGRLEVVLPEWKVSGGAVHWVSPPGGRRPKRVEALSDFVAEKLAPRRAPAAGQAPA